LFERINGGEHIDHVEGDVRDAERVANVLITFEPEIVLHLAAQVTVQDCFNDPHKAYGTNFMGNVNLLEAVRKCPSVKGVVSITTDKVYENKGDGAVYKVGDRLAGTDPCSTSNICVEVLAEAYKHSYLQADGITVGLATARPSNVIAGGDHVQTRLIPSILLGFSEGKPAEIRNPEQTRSWQSAIDALNGYMTIARKLYEEPITYSRPWNIGPTEEGICSVGEVFEKIRLYFGNSESYTVIESGTVKESMTLGLDIRESVSRLGWFPEQPLDKILFELTDFFKRQQRGEAEREICERQIREFFGVRNSEFGMRN
jgi:CDP-glucose 4,6-dehydratase